MSRENQSDAVFTRARQILQERQAALLICPRCKQRVLNPNDYGESAIYRSRHKLCVPCWHAEDAEIESKGGNDLPDTLHSYGPENDY